MQNNLTSYKIIILKIYEVIKSWSDRLKIHISMWLIIQFQLSNANWIESQVIYIQKKSPLYGLEKTKNALLIWL